MRQCNHFVPIQVVVVIWTGYLLIAEAHLPSSVARNVHATEEDAGIVGRRDNGVRTNDVAAAATSRRSPQLVLDVLMILLVDNIVHAVAVNQQVLLQQQQQQHTQKKKTIDLETISYANDRQPARSCLLFSFLSFFYLSLHFDFDFILVPSS